MRISAKGRYGLASMIYLAQNVGTNSWVNLAKIAEDLDLSKIYLEQVFALLKKAGLVVSIKGATGGYQLSRPSEQISTFDILNAIEITLFETTETTLGSKGTPIEQSLSTLVWKKLDIKIKDFLSQITLNDLVNDIIAKQTDSTFMYYI